MALKSAPLFVLPLLAVAATSANAADLVEAPPPPEFTSINYISIEGGPVWASSDISASESDKLGNIEDGTGFYAAATYRRMFNPSWDWQITGTGTWLGEATADGLFDEKVKADLDFQTADLDFGYHFNGNPLTRLLFGARVLHSTNSLNYDSGEDFIGKSSYDAEGWAIGPRVGLQSETMLGASKFGFVAEASGSVLFGSFDVDRSALWGGGTESSSESRTVYNLEGLAGLSWHASDNLTFTIGYRAQQWWGLREDTSVVGAGFDGDYNINVDEDVLVHGPFLRAGLTF